MGSAVKAVAKVTKSVTKPLSKAFKGVAKGILKVGKATMRGLATVNKKLGPLGSIAMAIAMPYALSGLGGAYANMAANATGPWGTFLKSVGNIGNQIRTGYSNFNTAIGKKFSTITNSIRQTFSSLAPKGSKINNIYSSISKGAKNLYTAAKEVTPKPFKGTKGTVQISGESFGGLAKDAYRTTTESAMELLPSLSKAGDGPFSNQVLGSKAGWFTNAGSTASDKLVTETINTAYKNKLKTYSPNALTHFNNLKSHSQKIGTYVNDSSIHTAIENSKGASKFFGDTDMVPEIDIDFSKTGDYLLKNPNEPTSYVFNGGETFKAEPVKRATKELAKRAAVTDLIGKYSTSLLKPTDKLAINYAMPSTSDMTMETNVSGYTGTNFDTSAGGSLFAAVYGQRGLNQYNRYAKNMNLLTS